MYEFDTIKRYIEMFDIDDYKSVIIISLFILLLSTGCAINNGPFTD